MLSTKMPFKAATTTNGQKNIYYLLPSLKDSPLNLFLILFLFLLQLYKKLCKHLVCKICLVPSRQVRASALICRPNSHFVA